MARTQPVIAARIWSDPRPSHDEYGETLGPLIRNGRPDKDMPAFSTLTAAQLPISSCFCTAGLRIPA